jgi:LPS sulfotransferase NodH
MAGHDLASPGYEPRITYVIASTPRTGSSLLCAGLSSTGVAGKPAEHVLPSLVPVSTQIAESIASTTTPNGIYGIKLQWHQFAYAVRQLRRGDAHSTSTPAQLIDRYLHEPIWFHLYRQDTAAQALSYYRAIYSAWS